MAGFFGGLGQGMAGLGAAMGGAPGIMNGLQTASPLLIAMAAGLKSGRGAMAGLPYGIQAMNEGIAARKKDQQEADALAAYGAPFGGGSGGFSGTPGTLPQGAVGVPGAMGTRNAGPGGSVQGYSLDPGKLPAVSQPLGAMFNEYEQKFQLPPGYLSRTAQIESGGKADAKNPNSSASGLFQFTKGTAAQYGVNPMDPASSTDGAARLAADNAATLRTALGREPNAAELYLAHQQGAGGAVALLTNPNAKAVDIVGRDAVKNNGGSSNMSAMDFANQWMGKFGGGAQANPMSNPRVQQLVRVLAMPGATEGIRSAANAELQMLLQQQDQQGLTPYQAAQLGQQDFQNQQAMQPQAPTPYQQAQIDLDKQRLEQQQAQFDTSLGIDQSKAAAEMTAAQLKKAEDMRKEFVALKPVQEFQAQSTAYGRVLAAGKNPSAAGDMALIFGYMKMLDPTSTVREGEYATAANAGGWGDRITALYNKAIAGQTLSQSMRDDFLDRAKATYKSAESQYKKTSDLYTGYAKKQGIDPSLAVPDFTAVDPPAEPPVPNAPEPGTKAAPIVIDGYSIVPAD